MIFCHERTLCGRPLRSPSVRPGSCAASSRPRGRFPAFLALFLVLVAAWQRPVLAEPSTGIPHAPLSAVVGAGESDPTSPPPAAATAPTRPAPRPADLEDLGAWLDYKRDTHRAALPDEARLFYRRGLIAFRAGHLQQANRLVRGAAELDPSFVTPHLTLASWTLARDPSQALLRYAVALDLARRSFLVQIELLANLVFFTLHGLFVGLLVTCLLVVLIHQGELRHMWHERLGRWLSPASARMWAWGILIIPFAVGLGLALPALVFMGLLWPLLRVRGRALFIAMTLAVLAAPFAGRALGRLAGPLHEDRGPLYGIASVPDEAWSPARQAAVADLAAKHPDNPFLQFGLGWLAREGGDLPVAEAAYRRALALWPQDARVMNNLANVLVARGDTPAAIDLYRSAMDADPEDAAAAFNLSLVFTRQFEYRAASEAAARASALDFELVKSQQALGTADGVLPMADQWIAPATFWTTVLEPEGRGWSEVALPPVWSGRIETSGPWFTALALILAIGAAFLGAAWQQALPLRPCRNCGRVVCRRCSRRRRELALCPTCARQESIAESPEFARVLLTRLRARRGRVQHVLRTALAILVPGYGLLAFHRVFRASFLIVGSVLLAAPWCGVNAPFSYHSWPGLSMGTASPGLTLLGWACIYANSLLAYFGQLAREAEQEAALREPVRSRPSAARTTAKAA